MSETQDYDSHVKHHQKRLSAIRNTFQDIGTWDKARCRHPDSIEAAAKTLTENGYPGCAVSAVEVAMRLG